jgi:hypothetical protein
MEIVFFMERTFFLVVFRAGRQAAAFGPIRRTGHAAPAWKKYL